MKLKKRNIKKIPLAVSMYCCSLKCTDGVKNGCGGMRNKNKTYLEKTNFVYVRCIRGQIGA